VRFSGSESERGAPERERRYTEDDELDTSEDERASRRSAALPRRGAAALAKATLAGRHVSAPAAPAMSVERAATLIQAGMRGLIARRGAEVQRCRLDLRAALADAKLRPGEPHPEVIQTMIDLGEAYFLAWDRHSAEQAYSVALQSIEREYGCVPIALRCIIARC
jgi:hypothetical protein